MLTRDEIYTMPIEDLRRHIQQALGLEEYPVSDWIAAGMMFEEANVYVYRLTEPSYAYRVHVRSKAAFEGIGSFEDPDAVLAIFRAYLDWKRHVELCRAEQEKEGR